MHADSNLSRNTSKRLPLKPRFQFALTILFLLILNIIVAYCIQKIFWMDHLLSTHTLLESVCIFVALCTFLIALYTHKLNSNTSHVLGFGFFSVVIFDILHTYFYPYLSAGSDLTLWFWILGRLMESIVVFISITFIRLRIKNRGVLFLMFCFAPLILSHMIIITFRDTPVLFPPHGLTPLKIGLEYMIILFYLCSIYLLYQKQHTKDSVIQYKYILIYLLMMICTEFSLTLYTSPYSFVTVLGHTFKITGYLYFFYGVFVSTLLYPYKQLMKKNHFIEDVLDGLHQGMITCTSEQELLFMNKQAAKLIGCDCIPSESNPMCCTLKKLLESGGLEQDSVFHASETSKVLLHNKIKTLETPDGKKIKLLFHVYQIKTGEYVYLFDEAKKEQEIKNLQLQTQTIINSIREPIVLFDYKDQVAACNHVFEKLLELSYDEIRGWKRNHLRKVLKASNSVPSFDAFYLKNTESIKESLTFITRNGIQREILINTSPIFNVDGQLIGTISIGTNMTEYKQQQEQMMQQEKLALLGQMGASIVHETKNFLSIIKGRSQLLTLLSEDTAIKNHAEKIDQATNEVNRILTDFLLLAKPNPPSFSWFSLNRIVQSLESLLEGSSMLRSGILHIDLSSDERLIKCDEGQIKQVLLNLCKNAVEAMVDHRSPLVQIQTALPPTKDYMILTVHDNGKGIPKEHAAKIGTPFFTTKSTGTGLGLSTCYKIIKEHNGKIELHSESGKGTTFRIFLPCINE